MSDRAVFRRTYLVLSLIIGTAPLAVDTSLPAMSDMASGLGVPVGAVQITLSAFFTGMAVGQLSWGTLADRFGRRPILLIGLAAYVGAAVALSLASSVDWMIPLRFMQGFGSAAVFIMSRAIARDLFDVTTSARMFARLFQTVGLFAVVCPVIGGQLTELFGWRAVFVFMAAWSGIGAVAILFGLTESLRNPDRDALRLGRIFASFVELLGDAKFRGYLILGAGAYIGLFAILAGMPIVVINHLGESPAVFGYLYSAVMIVYLAATMVSERLVRKRGIERIAAIGVAIIVASAAITLIAHLAGFVTLSTVFIVNAAVMIGFAFTMPATTAGALANFQHMAGRATSLMGFLHQGIGAVAIFLMGFARDGSPLAHTSAMVIAGCVTLLAYLFLVRPAIRSAG